MKWFLLKHLNRLVARLRGSVGWCGVAYNFNRHGIPDEEDDDSIWEGTEPQGIIKSWWGAFMFKYKFSSEEIK